MFIGGYGNSTSEVPVLASISVSKSVVITFVEFLILFLSSVVFVGFLSDLSEELGTILLHSSAFNIYS